MSKLTMLEPRNLTEAMQFAEHICKSGMVPKDYQGKPHNTLVAMQWGYELGLAPMQALQNISVINGKPSIWGDAMMALVKAHPDYRGCHEYMDGQVAVCEVKRALPDGDVEVTKRTFSIQEAQTAGLTGKGGAWKAYPNRMLALRARGFALRDAFADALAGIITTEEAKDYPDPEKNQAVKTVQAPLVGSEGDTVENILEAVSEAQSASNDIEPPTMLTLAIPGRESEQYQMQEEWAARYAELMLAMRQAEKLPHATRRTKLKELEQVNLYALNSIDLELNTELKQKRLDYNKQLSVKERGGDDDQSWPNP